MIFNCSLDNLAKSNVVCIQRYECANGDSGVRFKTADQLAHELAGYCYRAAISETIELIEHSFNYSVDCCIFGYVDNSNGYTESNTVTNAPYCVNGVNVCRLLNSAIDDYQYRDFAPIGYREFDILQAVHGFSYSKKEIHELPIKYDVFTVYGETGKFDFVIENGKIKVVN